MPSIFSKNCVLVGEVDSYCLVCCKLVSAEHDVLAHIQDSKHIHKLSSYDYIEKFRYDCIRKVAGVYFCGFCNMTFPTAAKVGLHVTEHTHMERKSVPMLRRADKGIMYQENILITDNAWNGLVDDTCVLCNVEFEDESVHKSEQNHILNLIKSRVTVSADNDIYRQVEDLYQCLTCNKVITDKVIKEHLDSNQHKSLKNNQDGNQTDVTNERSQENDLKDKTNDEKNLESGSGLTNKTSGNTDTLIDEQANGVDGKTLYTRPVLIKKNQEQTNLTSIPETVQNFAKKRGLSVINDNKIYCNTCRVEVPGSLQKIKEHVAGKRHTEKPEKLSKSYDFSKQAPIELKKMPIKEFVTSTEFVEIQPRGGNEVIPYVLFNTEYFVNVFKFLGLAKFNDKIICQICRVHVTQDNKDTHINSAQHKSVLDNCYIVTSVEGEFIRQLKPDLFDCTYCGHVEHDWDDMLDHLDTDEHKRCKGVHETLSLDYRMSVIVHHMENAKPLNLLAMLHHMHPF